MALAWLSQLCDADMAIRPMDRYFSAMDALCPMLTPKLPKVQPLS